MRLETSVAVHSVIAGDNKLLALFVNGSAFQSRATEGPVVAALWRGFVVELSEFVNVLLVDVSMVILIVAALLVAFTVGRLPFGTLW